jgi:hypothetical protein
MASGGQIGGGKMLRVVCLAALLVTLLAACRPGGQPSGSGPASGAVPGGVAMSGTAQAGPVCPVAQDPPDPACADKPVSGAVLVVRDGAGREAARVTTAADGSFTLVLAPGSYVLEPQPVEGFMGTAPAQKVVLTANGLTGLVVEYDTGIR